MATPAVCPKCGGTGFTIVEHANVSAAEPCDCRFQERAAHAEERAQIPPLYRNATFENFVVPGAENPIARRELTGVLLAVKVFVRDFATVKPPGLLLIGETGTGKTHIAVAALREIMKRHGREGLFCNYQTLLNNIKAGYDSASNSSNREAYQNTLDADVLLLDDLGAHRVSDWVEDTINSIVTYRCDNRKPLIATTNMPDPDARSTPMEGAESRSERSKPELRRTLAEQIGARARSRLFEMCTVIRMPLVEDYRVRKQKTF
jgi:DNA replication protein DnaC